MRTKNKEESTPKNLNLNEIEQFIKKIKTKPLTLVEAADYLSMSQSHIYKLTSQRKIPFHKPSGKYLYFYENELDEWIKEERNQNSEDSSQNDKEPEDEEEPP
ncbi:MAG: helix-turn-helix domain-containing protein [Flavobacteriales bacterium]|nr:helix-turn-helix domain-containing protein [Flavobacteriales bacterium]